MKFVEPSLVPACALTTAIFISCISIGMTAPARGAEPGLQVVLEAEKALDGYIFPSVATKLKAELAANEPKYAAISDSDHLAESMTSDLQQIAHDKHLRVFHSHQDWMEASDQDGPSKSEPEAQKARGYGFNALHRLPGNVGYLRLRYMAGPDSLPFLDAYETLLQNTDALILDIRDNGGGQTEGIDALTGWLFGDRRHLITMFTRDRYGHVSSEERYSVPQPRHPAYGKPVFVLTSKNTFSAGEEFAYDLKTLKRATIIGEQTAGGAHPGDFHRIGPDLVIFIPNGRAEGAATHEDWEGVGVIPDIPIAADKALLEAYARALKAAAPTVHSDDLDETRTEGIKDPMAMLHRAFNGGG